MATNVARLDDYRTNQAFEPPHIEIEQPDGGVIIAFGNNDPYAITEDVEGVEEDFYANLVDMVDPSSLGSIAWEILDGIQSDESSRSQWIADRARGMDLLAIKVEKSRTDLGASMEGMSTVRHPLLLEACIKFQSNFKREMLPPGGPVKVKNAGNGVAAADLEADKLGELMNRYFTEFSPEYYPDTDRMSFDLGFSGTAFKKPFHCPLRRRPVSDTVESKNLIVSNDATDLQTAQRVTHRIEMTQATMKRMQYVGAYRDVTLAMPDSQGATPLDVKQKQQQGLAAQPTRPQDQQYTVYECHTFLDLAGFEHEDEDGEPTGLPLPYVVTVEKQSRQILEIRRDWDQDSEAFERRVSFIAYHFVPMFGFYASGLLHILGNATQAVTGAWRILLDSGMFSNFPGFLYAKSGGRQEDLNFRVPPGGGAAVDLNGADDIHKTIMALPYKEPGAPTMQLVDNIVATASRVGGAAEFIDPAGVKQNMPVGTMMALVEQAAQTVSAVHERAFASQSHEFQQMLRLMREDPEAVWRFVEKDGTWTYDELVRVLDTYALVPVADPNTPTHVHRIMKMTVLKQLQASSPELYNARAVDERILRSIKIDDPETLFAPPAPPQAMAPDPSVIIAQTVAQTEQLKDATKKELELAKILVQAEKIIKDHEAKMAQIEAGKVQADQTDSVKLTDIDTRAETADKDRVSREHIASLQVQERIANSPYDDNNHSKAIELKRAAPPKPAGRAKNG